MDKEILEQFQMLAGMMESMAAQMQSLEDKFVTKLELNAVETRIMVYMENNITQRIDSLMDGYKMNYEQQHKLESRLETNTSVLQDQVDELQARVKRIENRTA